MNKLNAVVFVLLFSVIMSFWWIATRHEWLPPYLLPPPGKVLAVLGQQQSELFRASLSTVWTAITGFFLAAGFGLVTGVILHRSRILRAIVLPLMVSVKSTPIVAIVPLISLLFGVGFLSKLFLAFLICFFPMVLSTISGLASVPHGLIEFATAVAAPRRRFVLFVSLPSAASHILLGMKITLPLAFVGAVVAEMVGGYGTGLGYTIVSASYRLDAALLFAAVGLVMCLSTGVFYMMTTVAAFIHPPSREEEYS